MIRARSLMTQTKSEQQFTFAKVDGSVMIYLRLQENGSYQRVLVSDAFGSEDDSDKGINERITQAISTYFRQTKDVKSGYYLIVRVDENTTCVENLGYFFEDAVEVLQNLGIVVPFVAGECERVALTPVDREDVAAQADIQFDGRIAFKHHEAEQLADDSE